MAEGPTDRSLPLHTGRSIPILGLGTFQMRGRQAYDAVRTALEIGYRHLDTATGYRNQEEVGRAIRESGVPREEVFVTTKLPAENAGRERETLEESLRQLGLDQLDLWLIHWPPGGPGIDTWRAFIELRDEGKTRDIGVSNYSPAQIEALVEATGEAPTVNQIRWSPAIYDAPRLAHSRSHGVVLEGYSPFRASDLEDPAIADIAATHNVSVPQVILRWHLDTDVVAIPKSAQPDRQRQNFDIFNFQLTPAEIARLNALAKPEDQP